MLLTPCQVNTLPQVAGFDPESISIFSTRNQTKRSDQYFLDSSSKVGHQGACPQLADRGSSLPANRLGCGAPHTHHMVAVARCLSTVPCLHAHRTHRYVLPACPSCLLAHPACPPIQVSFFFEEKAFDEEGRLTIDKNRAINKIGHGALLRCAELRCAVKCSTVLYSGGSCGAVMFVAVLGRILRLNCDLPTTPPAAMHDLDPVFRRWTRSPKVAALMAALGFARPLPVQVGAQGCLILSLVPSSGRWLGLACAGDRGLGVWPVQHGCGVESRLVCPVPCWSAHILFAAPRLTLQMVPSSSPSRSLQSMLIFKQPFVGGEVVPHQVGWGGAAPGQAALLVVWRAFGGRLAHALCAPLTCLRHAVVATRCLPRPPGSFPCLLATQPGFCLPGHRALLLHRHLAGT